MLNYIALYPNKHADEFNMNFLESTFDDPLDDYVIACMKDFETIKNIEILEYTIINDQDEVDINNHMVNINFKKKNMDSIQIPKNMYMLDSRYHEIQFKIRISTNLNEKVILKRILVPTLHDGYYLINNTKMKAIWQLCDASTYSQRGKVTMKSRMPIIIYGNKHKITPDINGVEFVLPIYSYAQDTTKKRAYSSTKKKRTKFINPLMIYCAKMGMKRTIEFFGMDGIVSIKRSYTDREEDECYIFECNDVYVIAKQELFDKYELVKAFVCMAVNLQNRDFPVSTDVLEDRDYWICRIGYIGSVKNKNLYSFYEKGVTCINVIERLLNYFSIKSLRLPYIYKSNIYYIMYWMITNFDFLKQRVNIDMANKRIRKNEHIADSSLGRKVSENIMKLIERKSKSKQNTMDTLLELFNFNSDIIITGMRNSNDLIKSNDASNDMYFLNDMAYSAKGYQSIGESSSKMIAEKYRYLHPSMVGVVDLFTTSNSDCGMSGSITPFVQLYDGFFFTPDKEPCATRYLFEKSLFEDDGIDRHLKLDTFEDYIECITEKNDFFDDLSYEVIEIVEKEPEIVEIIDPDEFTNDSTENDE